MRENFQLGMSSSAELVELASRGGPTDLDLGARCRLLCELSESVRPIDIEAAVSLLEHAQVILEKLTDADESSAAAIAVSRAIHAVSPAKSWEIVAKCAVWPGLHVRQDFPAHLISSGEPKVLRAVSEWAQGLAIETQTRPAVVGP